MLLFLGRGYSPAYVAKKMFLSDSTVRSHIKSIYKSWTSTRARTFCSL